VQITWKKFTVTVGKEVVKKEFKLLIEHLYIAFLSALTGNPED